MQSISPKILLHCCCAPCTFFPVERLQQAGYDVTLYWENYNIHPLHEYIKRFQGVERFSRENCLPLVSNHNYDLSVFLESLNKHTRAPERCFSCYRYRLEKTFKKAQELSYSMITTTMLISPYQDHEFILQTGKDLSRNFKIDFIYEDFRKGFRNSLEKARRMEFYTQPYCGCIFSEYERYEKKYRKIQDSS